MLASEITVNCRRNACIKANLWRGCCTCFVQYHTRHQHQRRISSSSISLSSDRRLYNRLLVERLLRLVQRLNKYIPAYGMRIAARTSDVRNTGFQNIEVFRIINEALLVVNAAYNGTEP